LLVGKTASNSNTVGFQAGQNGFTAITRASGQPLILDRTTTDGAIQDFRKDGTSVGSIGTYFGDLFIASPSSTDAGLGFGSSKITPVTTTGAPRDNAIDLGASAARFKDLHLSGGVYLGGTGAANKLDDYETGDWTPVLSTSSGQTGTWSTLGGTYTKVGNLVTVFMRVTGTSMGFTGVYGYLKVTGFPFTSFANSGAEAQGSWASTSVAEGLSGAVFVPNSQSYAWMFAPSNTTATATTISFTVSYTTAA